MQPSNYRKAPILVAVLLSFACNPPKTETKSEKKPILVVLAHPDDETAFGAVLAKYARLGHPVQLIIAVTAENDTRHLQASPDSVRKAKQAQTICSAEKLGILPPLFAGHVSLDRKFGERWVDKHPLYYFGWTRSLEACGDGWVHYVDDAYLPIRVTYTDEDESRAFESLRCYTAGFSPEEMQEMITAETGRKNELFFRRLVVDTIKVEGLFP